MNDLNVKNMTEPEIYTQYMAEFRLSVLIRQSKRQDGTSGIETAWAKGGECEGPLLFVSALDAEIYRLNSEANGNTGWKRAALEHINLQQLIHACCGEMYCQMMFGFSATAYRQLALRDGYLRPLFLPLRFEISPKTKEPVTFKFNQWIFDFMCEQWAAIGANDYPEQLHCINDADDAQLIRQAAYALKKAEISNEWQECHDWTVFIADTGMWKFGPDKLRQPNRLH